jgi:endonuclease/exonuclease/phosphatase (EEP) superfamily protein YafD
MAAEHRHRRIPASLIGLLSAASVLALSLLETRIDGSATMFTGGYFHVGVAIGWIICAGLTALIVTRYVQIVAPVDEGAGLAVGYDALPILLLTAWVVTIAALVTRHWLLAALGAVLSLHHVSIIVPRMVAARAPRWANAAPTLDIVVANVFIDNKTPEAAARQLATSSADVIIVVESTAAFMAVFDEVGGRETYPHRVNDPADDSDYAVTVACRSELGPRSQMTTIGPLRLAIADIEVEGISTLVVALNPMATVDPGGHETWKEQIEGLKEFVPTLTGPVVIAGDLNTTRYRPEFQELLALGLKDAIDTLGMGLKPSFKLGADGVLATIGAVARLDHALVNDCIFPLSVENLDPCGSDHHPFELRVAVRRSRK